jgi:hypothetical protein
MRREEKRREENEQNAEKEWSAVFVVECGWGWCGWSCVQYTVWNMVECGGSMF